MSNDKPDGTDSDVPDVAVVARMLLGRKPDRVKQKSASSPLLRPAPDIVRSRTSATWYETLIHAAQMHCSAAPCKAHWRVFHCGLCGDPRDLYTVVYSSETVLRLCRGDHPWECMCGIAARPPYHRDPDDPTVYCTGCRPKKDTYVDVMHELEYNSDIIALFGIDRGDFN